MSGDAGVSIYPLFPRDLSTFSPRLDFAEIQIGVSCSRQARRPARARRGRSAIWISGAVESTLLTMVHLRSLIHVQSRSGPDGVRFCRYFHTRISLDTRITIYGTLGRRYTLRSSHARISVFTSSEAPICCSRSPSRPVPRGPRALTIACAWSRQDRRGNMGSDRSGSRRESTAYAHTR